MGPSPQELFELGLSEEQPGVYHREGKRFATISEAGGRFAVAFYSVTLYGVPIVGSIYDDRALAVAAIARVAAAFGQLIGQGVQHCRDDRGAVAAINGGNTLRA